MSVSENLRLIKQTIPSNVKLIAVSKTQPVARILEAYTAGQRIFGENRIQEMQEKKQLLPDDIEWHMIGHVQTNKIKYMAPFVSMVHGCDSIKLLREIDTHAAKNNRIIKCLLQVHIAKESTKFGFDANEIKELMINSDIFTYSNISIDGLMGMATFTSDVNVIRSEFEQLKSLSAFCQTVRPEMKEISMGMSGDYQMAIECGSTMVRIGSSIFGERAPTS